MPSPDLQHQRLRHLFASAILELWKKETGSVTSVLIEGTVCVTVHGGRTTVVQLSDRFAGLVNGDCERPEVGGSLRQSDGHVYVAPRSTAKSGSRTTMSTAQTKDSNNNVRTTTHETADDVDEQGPGGGTVDTDDDESSLLGDDDDSMVVDEDTSTLRRSAAAAVSYTQLTGDAKLDVDCAADDSAIHDMSMNRSSNSSLPNDSVTQSPPRGISGASNDLLLSSPHDYTAQVRNVIRQRLLNANGSKQSTPFRGQTSALPATINSACASSSRPQSSPYYRAAPDTTPPSLWIKRESPAAAVASEAMATAARRLASQYAAAAAATGQIPMTLMSPPAPPPLAMSVGLPLAGVPLGANIHNLLGLKSTTSPVGAAGLVAGTGSPRVPTSTPDSKRAGNLEPLVQGNNGDGGGGQPSAEQKIYRCDYCNKTFLFKSKYHEHLPVHTSARPFQCHLCTRTYKYKYDLRVHLRTHLGIPTKSTVCPFCAARFATNKFLRQHMRDAHSNQDAAMPSGPPAAAVPPASDEKTAEENLTTTENAGEEELMKDTEETKVLEVDELNESINADAVSPPPAVPDTVNTEGHNDDGVV